MKIMSTAIECVALKRLKLKVSLGRFLDSSKKDEFEYFVA